MNFIKFDTLTPAELRKLHTLLVHASVVDWLQLFLKEAIKWKNEYDDCIIAILQNYDCVLRNAPPARPVCSIGSQPKKVQIHLSIDIIFFKNKPFLHSIDMCTRLSEIALLRTTLLRNQITTFRIVQLKRHEIPNSISADQENNKAELKAFCSLLSIEGVY